MESAFRIEPALLADTPPEIADAAAELSAAAATLGAALHPLTAQSLAGLVRIMNSYYSNLIEGHHTRPRDIERALADDFDADEERRILQVEAAAHVRLQAEIDRMAASEKLPEPASADFLQYLHRAFYADAPPAMLQIVARDGRQLVMKPGNFRSSAPEDVVVGRHIPPSGPAVTSMMESFQRRYRLEPLGRAGRLMAMAAAHHRFNYIHPFPDGNGRVSRLMSHAMAHRAGIGAHGLWSVSRGLARGLDSRTEYKSMMDRADAPRQGDLDGRGNLSLRALEEFVLWFLRVCLDQVVFMISLFDLGNLAQRLRTHVARSLELRPEAERLLLETLVRGEIQRGEASRITGLPERTARRVLNAVVEDGLLASDTPKGALSLRFPADALESLFPRLYPQS